MTIFNKTISELRKPGGMTPDAWTTELRTKTAAQLATYKVDTVTQCCDDAVQACPDHDNDVAGYKVAKAAIRAKVQANGGIPAGLAALTVADIAPLLFRLCNVIEKNYEKCG
jgi:hypothetical protein